MTLVPFFSEEDALSDEAWKSAILLFFWGGGGGDTRYITKKLNWTKY